MTDPKPAEEAAESARLRAEQEAAEPWRFRPDPPDDGTCRDCWEWVLDCVPLGRHAWRSTCGYVDCDHHCHPPRDERYALAPPGAVSSA